jgi:hypothetical protein
VLLGHRVSFPSVHDREFAQFRYTAVVISTCCLYVDMNSDKKTAVN